MTTDLVFVLDLGSTKVACVAARAEGSRGLVVEGVATEPCAGLRRGLIVDEEETARAARATIAEVERLTGETADSLILAVGSPSVSGTEAQGLVPIYPNGRAITREDVLQVINHSRQIRGSGDTQQLQAIPREFRVDGQRGIQKPIGMNASRLEVSTYVVSGETKTLNAIERVVQRAGKKIESMVFQPLASAFGVVRPEELELGCVVVDLGGGTTSVAVFSNGSIVHGSVVPVGSAMVSSDVSKLLKTSPEEGERLKLEFGSALAGEVGQNEGVDVLQLGQTHTRPMQRRVLCEIIESRMREIANLVKAEVAKSGLVEFPGGVILVGGGSKMPSTTTLFHDVLGANTRLGSPKVGGPNRSTVNAPEYATAVGLAAYALNSDEDELSPNVAGDWKDRIRTLWSLLSGR